MKKISVIAALCAFTFTGFSYDGSKKNEPAKEEAATSVRSENDELSTPPPPETLYKSMRNGTAIHPGDADDFFVPPNSSTAVHSGSTACRTWWLNEPVYPGCPRDNSYYYTTGGTTLQTVPPSIWVTYCP